MWISDQNLKWNELKVFDEKAQKQKKIVQHSYI